jgi:hypothetical protein
MLNVAISPLIDKGNECKQSKHTLNFELGKGRASQGCLASQGIATPKLPFSSDNCKSSFESFRAGNLF